MSAEDGQWGRDNHKYHGKRRFIKEYAIILALPTARTGCTQISDLPAVSSNCIPLTDETLRIGAPLWKTPPQTWIVRNASIVSRSLHVVCDNQDLLTAVPDTSGQCH